MFCKQCKEVIRWYCMQSSENFHLKPSKKNLLSILRFWCGSNVKWSSNCCHVLVSTDFHWLVCVWLRVSLMSLTLLVWRKPFLENQQLTEIYHTYQGTAFCDYTDIICDDVHGRVLNFEYWVVDPFLWRGRGVG